ncbi:CoA-binding protein [Dethiobacter alkaliphilus]|uniref:CoA-binding domain protein n=1 Tax=Dethiobacter alkaliphilus AHT 1 TaxID=555088 RepID=C0GKJ1_DETAL|nr:CoA-binding protein [Dethiobacter alkaliphilus]EEG76158.1 CoA-binding domain protein [Dethiobacter alkaliphilus AHT 1]
MSVRTMLDKKSWAVVGVSKNKRKFGYRVYKRLKDAGYTVYAVNPNLSELDGDPVYADLASLPEVPEVVNCVVPPEVTTSIIPQCAKEGIKYVWMQPGADCREAFALAEENNIEAERACVMVELGRL